MSVRCPQLCRSGWSAFLSWVKSARTSSAAPRRLQRRRLLFESLEQRELLAGDFGFAAGFGGGEIDRGEAIAVDAAGYVYTTGVFGGTADFDPGGGTFNLTAGNSADAFVSKLDSAGNFVWAKQLGGESPFFGTSVFSHGIAVDSAGNVYTTGRFYGTVDFDPGADTFNLTSAGSGDVFVSKLDSGGDFVWAVRLGGAEQDSGQAIAVDSAGNVYTTGFFEVTADFDPGADTFNLTSAGSWDAFVSKLDSAGDFVWAKQFGGTSRDYASGIAVDSAGNVYTAGAFQGTVDFDPGPDTFNLTSAGYNNAFVSKLDNAGDFVWAKQLAGSDVAGLDIAVDAAGNVFTTGSFGGSTDFDPGGGQVWLDSAGSYDAFVSKLDSGGNFVWAKQLGGTNGENGLGIALDAAGNVYTTGYFYETADFDPGGGTFNLSSSGRNDVFVSKLDSGGDFVWAVRLGGAEQDAGQGIAVDSAGNIYTTGLFEVTADFDPGADTFNLTSAGRYDVFVSKLTQIPKFFVVDAAADATFAYTADGDAVFPTFLSDQNGVPKGAAAHPDGTRLWVIDKNRTVFVYDRDGNQIGQWTAEALQNPTGIATDGTHLWIVDKKAKQVLFYKKGGLRTEGSQSPVARRSFDLDRADKKPKGITTDGSKLWVVDSAKQEDRVFVYNKNGARLGSWTIASQNSDPTGITIDPSGDSDAVWIVDKAARKVFTYLGGATRRDGAAGADDRFSLAAGNGNPQGIADPPPSASASVQAPFADTQYVESKLDGAAPSSNTATKPTAADVLTEDHGPALNAADIAGAHNFFTPFQRLNTFTDATQSEDNAANHAVPLVNPRPVEPEPRMQHAILDYVFSKFAESPTESQTTNLDDDFDNVAEGLWAEGVVDRLLTY